MGEGVRGCRVGEGVVYAGRTMRRMLQFEYQQANLEAEVENLSWKVERAEITDRGVSVA